MKLIAIILILLLVGMFVVTTINISTCTVITRGIFAGRTACFFRTVTVQPGTTTEIDVNIES